MPEEKADKTPRHGKPEPQVGDAGLLFRDAAPAGPSSPRSQPAAVPGEEFDLVDISESPAESAAAQAPTLPRGAQSKAPAAGEPRGEGKASRSPEDSVLDPSDLVPEPWSRWAEWGMNLIILGAWLMLIILLAYIVSGMEFYALAFAFLIVGGLVAVVLSYPLIITLERPVRVTPEQALRDYYNALSHHVPHFRRMWLLLSTQQAAFPPRSDRSRDSRDTGRSSWAACAKAMQGRSRPWSLKSSTSKLRKARANPAST